MKLDITLENGVLVVTPLEARLDERVASAFRTAMLRQIEAGHRTVLVNMEHVDFVDSAGLGALASMLNSVGRDGDLRVCALAESVRSIFERTRLNRVIQVAMPVTTAVAV